MWSLTSEIAFYLVFPFLRRLSTRTLLILFAGSFLFGDVDTGLAYWLTGSTVLSSTPLGAAEVHARRHDRLSPSRPVRHALDGRCSPACSRWRCCS